MMKSLTLRAEFAWVLMATVLAACIALFVSVSAGYYALLFAGVAWCTWVWPEESLLWFILLAPLLPMFKLTQTVENFTLVKDVFIATLFARQVVRPLLTQTLPYRRNIFWAPIVALVIWLGAAWLRADSHVLGLLRARDLGMYIGLYFGVLYLPLNESIWRRRLQWFTWGLVMVLTLGIYQWLWAPDGAVLRFDPARSIWIPRISATFGHPTVFGEYLIAAICGLTAAVVVVKNKRWRWGAIIGIAVMLPFVYETYSRGVWLGLLAAWVAMGLAWLGQRLKIGRLSAVTWRKVGWGLLIAMIALGSVVGFTAVGTFLRSAFDPTYPSNQIRLQFVNRLIASTSNTDALIGKGLGDVVQQISLETTDVTAADILSGNARTVQLSQDNTLVDDQYLKTFIEMGLLGLLIYAWLYARWGKYAYRLIGRHEPMANMVGLMGVGFLVAFVIQALFVDIWDVFPTESYFWLTAAIISIFSGSGFDKI